MIYNPVLTEDLFASMHAPLDHPWFAPGEPPVVVNAARLALNKDHGTLLSAFELARRERPSRLLILGEGEERPRLERLVRELRLQDVVALAGFVDNPYPYLARASVFASASTSDALPTAMIEALACGTPVVATDCRSGQSEILGGGRFGRLVPERDPRALAEALVATLDDPPDPQLLEARARDFSADRAIKRYRTVLEV